MIQNSMNGEFVVKAANGLSIPGRFPAATGIGRCASQSQLKVMPMSPGIPPG
jgi:hypothetical protein